MNLFLKAKPIEADGKLKIKDSVLKKILQVIITVFIGIQDLKVVDNMLILLLKDKFSSNSMKPKVSLK